MRREVAKIQKIPRIWPYFKVIPGRVWVMPGSAIPGRNWGVAGYPSTSSFNGSRQWAWSVRL